MLKRHEFEKRRIKETYGQGHEVETRMKETYEC